MKTLVYRFLCALYFQPALRKKKNCMWIVQLDAMGIIRQNKKHPKNNFHQKKLFLFTGNKYVV